MKRPDKFGDKSLEKARKNGNYIQERADKMKDNKGDDKDDVKTGKKKPTKVMKDLKRRKPQK